VLKYHNYHTVKAFTTKQNKNATKLALRLYIKLHRNALRRVYFDFELASVVRYIHGVTSRDDTPSCWCNLKNELVTPFENWLCKNSKLLSFGLSFFNVG